ncbi:MAG: diaminopimelate epimerase [Puniceicoccales bacterium]|nr:diaminopimelate epimerase [Puniceicoccales bacterium]
MLTFEKYQALGNDYLVFRNDHGEELDEAIVRFACDRHYGIGADGVLIGNRLGDNRFRLEIFNSDGSRAEKSGNGLRIFAQFVWDERLTVADDLIVVTLAGESVCRKFGGEICVNMGRPMFAAVNIPVPADFSQCIDDQALELHAVSIGNPHCVLYVDDLDLNYTRKIGPILEKLAIFPQHSNVQFVKIISNSLIQMHIWERGVGYTLSSGSCACAAFAVCKKLGYCGSSVVAEMPGGKLVMKETALGEVLQYGQAIKIASCFIKKIRPTI